MFHTITSGLFGRQTNKMPNPTSIQAYELFTSRKSLKKDSSFFSLLRAVFCYIKKNSIKTRNGQSMRRKFSCK